MPERSDNPYASLNKVFHEPSRLAIMSALCGAPAGLSFSELKTECALTDGNLSRHLKTLEEAAAIKVRKTFTRSRPKTTVQISDLGREGFVHYLAALEGVLRVAAEAVATDERLPSLSAMWDGALLGGPGRG